MLLVCHRRIYNGVLITNGRHRNDLGKSTAVMRKTRQFFRTAHPVENAYWQKLIIAGKNTRVYVVKFHPTDETLFRRTLISQGE